MPGKKKDIKKKEVKDLFKQLKKKTSIKVKVVNHSF